MKTNLCELLNIKYPILQGAMARISESSLVISVSEAGGLGILAGGNAPKDYIVNEIRKIKKGTDKPFAVNIMLLSPFCDDIVDAICEEGVPIVTTGAGDPSKYMNKFKENDIIVIPVVPSVAIAKRMERLGVDAIIAEGMEAGGHIGKTTTLPLIPQIVDAVSIPVIAAGGIGDGRGAFAMFALGAVGVQIGTRFLVSTECIIHQNYKDKILKSSDISTVTTGAITGHPVRGLKNKLTKDYEIIERKEFAKEVPCFDELEKITLGALERAVSGDVITGTLMAGQIAGMINKEQSSKEIIDDIVVEFENTKKRLGV